MANTKTRQRYAVVLKRIPGVAIAINLDQGMADHLAEAMTALDVEVQPDNGQWDELSIAGAFEDLLDGQRRRQARHAAAPWRSR